MRKRLVYSAGLALLAVSVTLLVWQGSFTFGSFGPANPTQTFVYWAASLLVFLLTVTLGFMLLRTAVKLYIERQTSREGSRIRTKLVVGALALSFLPTVFAVLWGVYVLNRNVDKWFSLPAEGVRLNLVELGEEVDRLLSKQAQGRAELVAQLPETLAWLRGTGAAGNAQRICQEYELAAAALIRANGTREPLCGDSGALEPAPGRTVVRQVPVRDGALVLGSAVVSISVPVEVARHQAEISRHVREYDRLAVGRKDIRNFYLMLLALITLFILFVATWIALFLAKQISVPISALLDGVRQVRSGVLGYRVQTAAIDELATLVRAFNDMTAALERNRRELEERRRFTEAILESIPTGVISLSAHGRILKVNPALRGIVAAERVDSAQRLEDLFSREDAAEIRYLMSRARRLGVASRQHELHDGGQVKHLALTVAALEHGGAPGFVMILEDTSEQLRAQKAAAWQEVARRVAHEIKNPLTPIALSAERIERQLERTGISPDAARIVRECTSIIGAEVESVKALVDEFAQFARLPAARPVPGDLNAVVQEALAAFAGRLDQITVQADLAPGLPQVPIDREQFKRVVVNLVDNAAEAMRETAVRRLYVSTQAPAEDTVELVIADTGCGISAEDKEKLFLPYFSTKDRGTGLGLAIVNHIVAEHHARIRVEDNLPAGARFVIEIPVPVSAAAEPKVAEIHA